MHLLYSVPIVIVSLWKLSLQMIKLWINLYLFSGRNAWLMSCWDNNLYRQSSKLLPLPGAWLVKLSFAYCQRLGWISFVDSNILSSILWLQGNDRCFPFVTFAATDICQRLHQMISADLCNFDSWTAIIDEVERTCKVSHFFGSFLPFELLIYS